MASQTTIGRLENQISRTELYRMAIAFVDHFLNSYDEVPSIIVVDFDDTANIVHGCQQMALFNGYYGETCYEPMHLYEGLSGKLIATILRPGKRPNGHEIVSYVRRIISNIRPSLAFVHPVPHRHLFTHINPASIYMTGVGAYAAIRDGC